MLKRSDSCNELFAALAKFTGEVSSPSKDAVNKYVGNRYASLGEVLATARPALSGCGLAFVQGIAVDDVIVSVTSALVHASGQWMENTIACRPVRAPRGQAPFTLPASEATIQEIAAASSYLRRYAALSMLCMAAEDDTDGEPPRQQAPAEPQRQQAPAEPRQQASAKPPAPIVATPPKHRHDREVAEICNSLPQATTEAHLRELARGLLDHHGPIGDTAPWRQFATRCADFELVWRDVVRDAEMVTDPKVAP